MGEAAGVAYSEEALYAADLPSKSVYMIALPDPGTDTRVLTGRGPAASSRAPGQSAAAATPPASRNSGSPRPRSIHYVDKD